MKVSGPVSSIILNTARFSATLSCRAGCTNNGHKVSRTDLYSPVCAIAISLRRRSVCSGVSERRSIQQSEVLNAVGLLAHHLESDVTAHRKPAQRKSMGCRCEDCPGDRTHRVVSRVICDTYCDLSPQ